MTDEKYVEIEDRPIYLKLVTFMFLGTAIAGYWIGHPLIGEFNWISYFGGLWTGVFAAATVKFWSLTETKKVPIKSKNNE